MPRSVFHDRERVGNYGFADSPASTTCSVTRSSPTARSSSTASAGSRGKRRRPWSWWMSTRLPRILRRSSDCSTPGWQGRPCGSSWWHVGARLWPTGCWGRRD